MNAFRPESPWFLILFTLASFLMMLVLVKTLTSGIRTPLPWDPNEQIILHARVFRRTREHRRARVHHRAGVALVGRNANADTYGRLSLMDGYLRWNPDYGSPWAAAVPSITVLRTTGMLSTMPRLEIDIEGSGQWLVVVSDKPINRALRNSAKTFREARRARELAAILVARGARSIGH